MPLLLALSLIAAVTDPKAACAGATTLEVNACEKVKFDQAVIVLDRYYKAALNKLQKDKQPMVVQSLVKAQRGWIGYRDAECGAIFDRWSGGTIRISMEYDCRTRLTQLRSYTIWKNWLTFVDSTPPILPRPPVEDAIADR